MLRKKISFQILPLIDNAPGNSRALTEMYDKSNVFFPDNTTFTLQPMDQVVILTFKAYYLGDTFCKVIAAIDSNSFDGSGKNRLKTSWKGITILDATKNIS